MYVVCFYLAASLESNIVFSPNSYLPRSASLNLTVDIFGQSVNLLEACYRFKNNYRLLKRLKSFLVFSLMGEWRDSNFISSHFSDQVVFTTRRK